MRVRGNSLRSRGGVDHPLDVMFNIRVPRRLMPEAAGLLCA